MKHKHPLVRNCGLILLDLAIFGSHQRSLFQAQSPAVPRTKSATLREYLIQGGCADHGDRRGSTVPRRQLIPRR
jgi:hypothetical protein